MELAVANQESPIAAYAKVVKQAWSDPAFKARLMENPQASLAAAGVPVPAGVTVKVLEDTDEVVHLVLPPQTGDDALSDDHLDLVAGGMAKIIQENTTG